MANRAKQKGDRLERKVVQDALDFNLEAKKIPLSGMCKDFKGDVEIEGKLYECKSRRDSFKFLYQHIEGMRGLIVRADRKEELIVITLKDYLEMLELLKNREDSVDVYA